MGDLLAGVASVTIPLVLLGSLFGQVRRPGMLAAALRAHRTVPGPLVGRVAMAALAAETIAGLDAAIGLLFWQDGLVRTALALSALLLAAYAVYAAYVVWTRPSGVPCGCAGDIESPMTVWISARAGLLALLSLAGAFGGLPAQAHGAPVAITFLAGTGFAIILWTLPQAMTTERRPA